MSFAMVVSPYVLIDKPPEGPLNSWTAAYQEQVLPLQQCRRAVCPANAEMQIFVKTLTLGQDHHTRSSPVTPLKTSKLKSKTRRASHLTSSV